MNATPTTTILGLAAGVAAALVLAGLAFAAEDPPASEASRTVPPATAAAAPSAATPATAPGAVAAGTPAPAPASAPSPAASPGAPAKPDAARSTPQRFEPTEKVRADFEVSFPIDI
jgi:hypothetical protein